MGLRLGRLAPLAPYLLALASGLLWGAAFGRTSWILGGWLALSPLLVLLGHPRAGRLAYLHGLAAWGLGLSWIPATLTRFGGLPGVAAGGCLLILASYLALFEVAFARLGRAFWLRGGATALVGLPALWVGLEWLRAHLIGGFPWNLAAYAWVDVPGALPLSAWIGAYGVSFLVLFANVGVAQTWMAPARADGAEGGLRVRVAPLAIALLVPLLLLGLGGRATHRAGLDRQIERIERGDFGRPVRIVQPNLPIRTDWDPEQAYRDYRRAIELASDSCEPGALVVLPESALWPFSYDHDPVLRNDLATLVARGCSLVFNSQTSASETKIFNSAYLLSPVPPEVTRYDKRHLVPFGEYIPFSALLGWVGRMARGIGEYTPGADVVLLPWKGAGAAHHALEAPDDRVGMAICYEVVYPEDVADLSRAGATILASVTNDAWYGDTWAPYQHLRAARFRAAENRKPLLRAGLTGVSALIGPDGAEQERVPLGTTGVIRARVTGEEGVTPYARAPWLPPLLASLFALFAIIRCRWSTSRRDHPAR